MKLQPIITLFVSALCASAQTPVDLTVEYLTTPVGLDVDQPRFGWKMEIDLSRQGQRQVARRLLVVAESGDTVWNSGFVSDGQSVGIKYDDEPLQPTTRYDWTIDVVDEKGDTASTSSWFETGLMPNRDFNEAWSGARWITPGDSRPLYAAYLPVFKLQYDLKFIKGPRKASILFGMGDERFRRSHLNPWKRVTAPDSTYIRVEIDAETLPARVNVYRANYMADDDSSKPLKSFDVPLEIINNTNVNSTHDVEIAVNMGHVDVFIDGNKVGYVGVNPLGNGSGFTAFPVVGDIAVTVPSKAKVEFETIKLKHFKSPSNVIDAISPGVVKGENMAFKFKQQAPPVYRRELNIKDKPVKRARIYVTARGIFDVKVNGILANDEYFAPGATQYDKTLRYSTLDLTSRLHPGANRVEIPVYEGWWSGAATYEGEKWNQFGDTQSALAKIVVEYDDGEQEIIVTGDPEWSYMDNPHVVESSFFQGEIYDARDKGNIAAKAPVAESLETVYMTGTPVAPVMAIDTLVAKSVSQIAKDVYIYDMGQNFAGVPYITLDPVAEGDTIMMRYAEVLYPDMPRYEDNKGEMMLENIRAAMNREMYIGGKDNLKVFSPRATFHGYRFIEITGYDHPLPLKYVKGLVLSSLPRETASYETSSSLVNRLWENVKWSTRSNTISIPTDCPQRNERMGWAGDISVFSPSGVYLGMTPGFLSGYLRSMRDLQSPEGRFPDIAPFGGGFGGLLWGSAGITVAHEAFMQYGDTTMLAEHYPAMTRYIDYILKHDIDSVSGLVVQNRQWGDLGDWLAPEDDKNDKSLLWEAQFIHNLDLMARMANALGREDDASNYESLAAKRREFFTATYLDKESGTTVRSAFDPKEEGQLIDTQTSYALPLAFDIINDNDLRDKAVYNLTATLMREDTARYGTKYPPYSVLTGFIGTSVIADALTDAGHPGDSYRLLTSTTYPSWLFPVTQGATTVWERLNSFTLEDGFGENNSMNSFNHYSFGAVAEWMISRSAGIRRDPTSPGFKHFILQPFVDPTSSITSASAYYDSPYGRIESSWEIVGDRVIYCFVVPANTTATLLLPGINMELTSGRCEISIPYQP